MSIKHELKEIKIIIYCSIVFLILGIVGIIIGFTNTGNKDLEFFGLLGIILAFGGQLCLLIAIIRYFVAKNYYKSHEDARRNPIDFEDKNYEKLSAIQENHVKEFLKTVQFPAGFQEYTNSENTNKYIIKDRGDYGNFFEIDEKIPLNQVKTYTEELMLGDDYHTQFRDLLVFAVDISGHGHFLLDYSQSTTNPSVKFLDNEIDILEEVAPTFQDFLKNLTQTDPEYD